MEIMVVVLVGAVAVADVTIVACSRERWHYESGMVLGQSQYICIKYGQMYILLHNCFTQMYLPHSQPVITLYICVLIPTS